MCKHIEDATLLASASPSPMASAILINHRGHRDNPRVVTSLSFGFRRARLAQVTLQMMTKSRKIVDPHRSRNGRC